MRYNIELSASRIREERTSMMCIVSRDESDTRIITLSGDDNPDAMEMTQEYLLAYMRQNHLDTIGRNKLSALENGDPKAFYSMTLSQWSAFCDVFGVSIDYLTGKEPYKTPTIKALCEITGLSETAAEKIARWNQVADGKLCSLLSEIIENPLFDEIMIDYITSLMGYSDGTNPDNHGSDGLKSRVTFLYMVQQTFTQIIKEMSDRRMSAE